ncbi:MAG: TolC family protein [Clostridium sp.]|nr:TolC family protein [Prevotella sp.]MCM1429331.1 TolC family protein [Clostridium sp.]MCM1475635.1 TolC family protein [Muribaculaceae bacterium]
MNIRKYSLVIATGMMLCSCQLYKKYELPADRSVIAQDYKRAVEATPDSTTLPYLGWEQVFKDPILQDYIRRALKDNVNLDNARLNIDAAKAQLKGAKLSYFPSLAITPNVGTATYGGSHMNWSYTIPAALNWEIDAFAKILNRKRGTQVGVEQAEAYRQAVQSQIVCGVANTYYAIVLLNQQLALTKRTAEIWADQVESMELMMNAGRTNNAAVVQSRAQYYSILATIPDLENQLQTTHNALSLLLNTYPGQTWNVTSNLDFDMPMEIEGGVPMAYLAARPDVYAQERALAVAYYQTNSARAAFYPSLNISAQGGFTNLLGSIIKNPGEWFLQLAGSLTAPIFSRGQNIATLEAAKVSQQVALNNFEYSVLSAAADVSDALIGIRTNSEKHEALIKQVENLEKSVEYTSELFSFGQSTTYLEVLTAQSGLLNAQMASLACWHGKVTSLISLYQAVGGGR